MRNSAHELLRIFAMLMIVFYHLVSYYLYLIPHDSSRDYILESFLPTIHIGVILFVLITGYYQIRFSIRGLFKLLFAIFVYYVILKIGQCVYSGGNVMTSLMFITHTPYWFIRTYLYLYLISPILNKFLDTASNKQRNGLLLALAIIAVYFGSTKGDNSLIDGKNLVNFTFLYFLGYTIHTYYEKWSAIPSVCIFAALAILNAVTIVTLWLCGRESALGHFIWSLSFPYCSPLLILSALLVFMLFTKIKVASNAINYIASSMFAVYLIHCQPTIHNHVIIPIVSKFTAYQPVTLIGVLIGMAICVMVVCVVIDKILSPVWYLGEQLGRRLEKKIGQ